jgi:hypothetical protein
MGGIMGILGTLKDLLRDKWALEKEQVESLLQLSPEDKKIRIGAMLHETCVRNAAEFVQQELGRKDSPFRTLGKTDFFHEMLILNFWMVDKLFRKEGVLEAVCRTYSTSFDWGPELCHEELVKSIRERHGQYTATWSDETGFQNAFGEKVTEMLFGKKEGIRVRESSYWIISYTDKTLKGFKQMKKHIKNVGGITPGKN